MGTDGKPPESAYAVSPVAAYEQAVTTAAALRLLECSREMIVIELARKYGYSNSEATRILREATVRDPHPPVPGRKKRLR